MLFGLKYDLASVKLYIIELPFVKPLLIKNKTNPKLRKLRNLFQ